MNVTCRKPGCSPRRAFTLVELLIVITIIGILVALLTVAAVRALVTARQARIKVELDQLSMAMETYKQEVGGGSYPPNLMRDPANPNLAYNDFLRHFKQAFPRHREPTALLKAIAGISSTNPSEGAVSVSLPGGMNGAEAMVFWAGGFSKDPEYPLSGPGGPSYRVSGGPSAHQEDPIEERNWVMPLDIGRLGPRDAEKYFDPATGRHVLYRDPKDPSQQRRINFWMYVPEGSAEPYVYFDCSRHAPADYDMAPWEARTASPYHVHAVKAQAANALSPIIKFANDGKFQILHCGVDDAWGLQFDSFGMEHTAGNPVTFPAGPFVGELADTLVNFSERNLGDAQE